MSKVIDFRRPPTVPETLKDRFGEDHLYLQSCGEWHAARAQIQQNWALHDLQSGWGYLDDSNVRLDTGPLDSMKVREYTLSMYKPRTVLLARELLRMCVTILAHANVDEKSPLAEGPVIEMVRNVLESLENLPGDTPISEAARRKRIKRRRAAKQ